MASNLPRYYAKTIKIANGFVYRFSKKEKPLN